jgi:hypothetical protein
MTWAGPGATAPDFRPGKDFLPKASAAPQVLADNYLLLAHNRNSEDETANS